MSTWGWVLLNDRYLCYLNISDRSPHKLLGQLGEHVSTLSCVKVEQEDEHFSNPPSLKRVQCTTDNICGRIAMNFDEISKVLLQKIAERCPTEHFYGVNNIFHTMHGRFTVQANNIVDFKGVRDVRDICKFQQQISASVQPSRCVCHMIAANIHYHFPIVLGSTCSLFLHLMETFASYTFRPQVQLDQSSLLNFNLTTWDHLALSIQRLWSGPFSQRLADAQGRIRDELKPPRAFFGVTRNSVFFVRITMQEGRLLIDSETNFEQYFIVFAAFFSALLHQIGFPYVPHDTLESIFGDRQNNLM